MSHFGPTVLPATTHKYIYYINTIRYLLYRLVYLEEKNKYNPLIPRMPNLISFLRHLKQIYISNFKRAFNHDLIVFSIQILTFNDETDS